MCHINTLYKCYANVQPQWSTIFGNQIQQGGRSIAFHLAFSQKNRSRIHRARWRFTCQTLKPAKYFKNKIRELKNTFFSKKKRLLDKSSFKFFIWPTCVIARYFSGPGKPGRSWQIFRDCTSHRVCPNDNRTSSRPTEICTPIGNLCLPMN